MKLPSWPAGVYALPVAVILIFSAALLYGLHRLDVQHNLVREATRTGAWITSQAALERYRFLDVLQRYVQGDSDVSTDDVLLRFDLFWSRVPLLMAGQEAVKLQNAAALPALVADLERTFQDIEPMVTKLNRGDRVAYEAIRGELDRYAAPLSSLMRFTMATGRPIVEETEMRAAFQWVEWTYAAVMASGGFLIILVVYKTQRSAALRKATENAKEDAEKATNRLSDALENISDGFVLFDADERLVLCNTRYRELCEGVADLLAPGVRYEDLARASVARGRVDIDRKAADAWVEHQRRRRLEPAGATELVCFGGRWIRLADRRTGDGGFVGVRTDITELKRTEQGLKESEERIRSIVDNSPNAIFLKDTDGRYQLVNERFVEWCGIDGTTAIGRTTAELMPPETADAFAALDSDVLRDLKPVEAERELISHDGSRRCLQITEFPVFDVDGNVNGVAAICEDVTDQKAAQKQLQQAQKMEAVGQLTGGIAHDFNNLLMAVLGNLELVGDDVDAEHPASQLIDTAVRAASRGAELTQRLLAFSRQQALMPAATDVNALVQEMTEQLLRRTLPANIEIETNLAEPLWPAMIDPVQLESALLNLAINARDAMPEGGRISITTKNETLDDAFARRHEDVAPGRYVGIDVRDNGEGMTADVCAHAFEPFFTTKDIGVGSGLGLSMVYGFAKQSGGHVAIDSVPDNGATIALYLPCADDAARLEHDSDMHKRVAKPGQGCVLVVEDDIDVRDYVVTALKRLGYTVYQAADGPEALVRLEAIEGGIDLLLTDVMLPRGMNGPDVAARVGERHRHVKTLYMSGYTAQTIGDGNRIDGPMLHKPFPREDLAQAVAAMLPSAS